jgi:hypothetical protein
MLFDLRGRGRRNAIKVIYVTLAILLGGGLVLFGIGGETSGGLVDAITEGGGSGDSGEDRFVKREREAAAATRRNPRDAAAWATLARTRFSQAGLGENFDPSRNAYTAAGRRKLEGASEAWQRFLALDPPPQQAGQVAGIMAQAYGPQGLDREEDAVRALEVIAEARPGSNTYANLAIAAYGADQKRKGDLAKTKALELADKGERTALKDQIEAEEKQAGAAAAGATDSATGE